MYKHVFWTVYLLALLVTRHKIVFMFDIFHPHSNEGLKASLALMHMITFIL